MTCEFAPFARVRDQISNHLLKERDYLPLTPTPQVYQLSTFNTKYKKLPRERYPVPLHAESNLNFGFLADFILRLYSMGQKHNSPHFLLFIIIQLGFFSALYLLFFLVLLLIVLVTFIECNSFNPKHWN